MNDNKPALRIAPERHTVRATRGHRFVHLQIDVPRTTAQKERLPLTVALVIDRSGSMGGDKLEMAKQATTRVIAQLDERDRFAVVTFDEAVEVVQPLAIASHDVKQRATALVARIEIGGSTALYDGWAAGARQIWADAPPATDGRLNRLLLLTDGQANCGLVDPSEIARQASLMREQHRIGTTTFGIGEDYNRELLLHMAQAGGGEFHHLRAGVDIVATFAHELGEMFQVAAPGVALEAEISNGAALEMITPGWTRDATVAAHLRTPVGDLMAGETRHLVVRAKFPAGSGGTFTMKARVVWNEGGGDWETFDFVRADTHAADAEVRDRAVMHWVGLHRAQRATIKAMAMMENQDPQAAIGYLEDIQRWIAGHANGDPEMMAAAEKLRATAHDIRNRRTSPAYYREETYRSSRSARGKGDARIS